MSSNVPSTQAASGEANEVATLHFYNPNAVLNTPVTVDQVTRFRVQGAFAPLLVLADGSYYYGDVDVPGRVGSGAVPHGVGLMLFKAAAARGSASASPAGPLSTPPSPAPPGAPPAPTAHATAPSAGGVPPSVSPPLTIPAPSKSGNYNLEQTCLAFDAGDRYGGSWSFGLFEGSGVLVTSTFTYQGNWSGGKMHGKGHMQYGKGFVDRMPGAGGGSEGGVGALLWKGLSMLSPFEDSAHKPREYIGDFDRTQLRHGQGLLRYYNGDVYEGHWSSNRRNGKGKLTQADGEVYEGDWVNDVREGYGTIIYPDGRKFKGHLSRGERDGEGVLMYANGDEYYGLFVRDKLQGQGTMRYKNGDLYEGEWKDGMRNGKGKYTLKKKKSIVEGTFVNGLIHGPGTVENPGISLFVGEFLRGERSQGTMFFFQGAPGDLHNVACYQGEWVSERIQGKGLMWMRNGDFYYGSFWHNERSGQGNMRYAVDSSEYSGGFTQNKRDGWGIWQAADGLIKAGRWSADCFVEGYEGEWDGAQLNGVGYMRLALDTFLFGPQDDGQSRGKHKNNNNKNNNNNSQKSTSPRSSPTSANPKVGKSGRVCVAETLRPGEAVEFFGLFSNGRRDGPGVLRVPAVLSELFPALPVPSFRQATLAAASAASSADTTKTQRRFFFRSAAAKRAAAAAAANVEAAAAVRRRRLACGVADDVEVGEDAAPVCPARHVIKGAWRGGVLECDHGVWAFPSGEVYVGGFHRGQRGTRRKGVPSYLWCADGSVHVGFWRDDAPSGEGLFFSKNNADPKIWSESMSLAEEAYEAQRRGGDDNDEDEDGEEDDAQAQNVDEQVDSRRRRAAEKASQTRREASLRAAASVPTTSASSSLALDVVFNFFPQASSADASVPVTAAAELAKRKEKPDGATDPAQASAAQVPPQNEHQGNAHRERRVLVGYGEHLLVESHWEASAVPEMGYFYGLQPSVFPGPRPVDANPFSTVMDALGYLPEAALVRHAMGHDAHQTDTAAATASPSTPQPVSSRTLSLPPNVMVGRAEDKRARVWFSGTGVCLESSFRGNHARLAIPHRPNSLFDTQYVQGMQKIGALPSEFRAPSQQSNMTAWLAWHHAACTAAIREKHKREIEGALNAALTDDLAARPLSPTPQPQQKSHLTIKAMSAEARALLESGPPPFATGSAALARCTFCGKEFGLFRRATQCTLCFRVACGACLGNLELTAPLDGSGKAAEASAAVTTTAASGAPVQVTPPSSAAAPISSVHAAALESYALLQAGLTKSAATWKKEKPEDLFDVLQDVPTNLEAYRNELIGQGITSVPTCVDCVRSLLLKIQMHTLWIPAAMFPNASVAASAWLNESPHDSKPLVAVVATADDAQGRVETHREESQRRDRESLEESLPPPTTEANATETESSAHVVATTSPDRHEDGVPTATALVETSPQPRAPTPATLSSSPPAAEQPRETVTRAPPTFYVVYSGYTTGQMVPHLFGELWWGQRAYYRGGFRDGLRHGFGTQIFCASGEKYVGEFKDDAWHGFGLFFYADGSVLHGCFRQNALVRTLYRGEVDAEWRRHGRGVAYDLEAGLLYNHHHQPTNENSSLAVSSSSSSPSARVSYNGEWEHGERHGTGVFQCYTRSAMKPAGNQRATPRDDSNNNVSSSAGAGDVEPIVYSGQFAHDRIEGMGKLVSADSAFYGTFLFNEKHGKGVEFFSDMAIEGTWADGALDGFCRLFFCNKETIYETTYSLGNERDDCFPPPLMVDDAEAQTCGQCGTAFSVFTRRHHCRLCGHVFCDGCSQKRAQLPAHFKVSGQPQQRVCDGCFDRLGQRRSLAICRYRDGSVYAGCWSHGRWVSRGLYCRADGLFLLFNHRGELISADTSAENTTGAAKPTETETDTAGGGGGEKSPRPRRGQTPPLRDEVSLSVPELTALTVSSPVSEVDKFILWWASTVTRCQLHVALDVPLLQRLQTLRRTEESLTPARGAMVKGARPTMCITAGTALAAQLSAIAVRKSLGEGPTAAAAGKKASTTTVTDDDDGVKDKAMSFFVYPTPPSQPPLHMFVPFQQFIDAEEQRTQRQQQSEEEKGSEGQGGGGGERGAVSAATSRVVGGDDAIQAAALRASLFTPSVAPPAPSYPPPPATTSTTDATTSHNSGVAGEERGLARPLFASAPCDAHETAPVRVTLPTPPTFAAHDVSDETVLKQIAEERVTRFLRFPPPSVTPDRTTNAVSPAAETPAMPLLASYSRQPMLKPTPLPPASGTNVKVPWDDFNTRSATALITPPSPLVPSDAESGDAAQRKGRSGPNTLGDYSDARVLFACPFLPPAVPDVQRTLEVGKVKKLADMMLGDVAGGLAHADGKSEENDDDDSVSSLVRSAWETRCKALLNTVPGAASGSHEALQKETNASPFATFFIRGFQSQLFAGASGQGAAKKQKTKTEPAPRAGDGGGGSGASDAVAADVLNLKSDVAGWLPGLFRGPLPNSST